MENETSHILPSVPVLPDPRVWVQKRRVAQALERIKQQKAKVRAYAHLEVEARRAVDDLKSRVVRGEALFGPDGREDLILYSGPVEVAQRITELVDSAWNADWLALPSSSTYAEVRLRPVPESMVEPEALLPPREYAAREAAQRASEVAAYDRSLTIERVMQDALVTAYVDYFAARVAAGEHLFGDRAHEVCADSEAVCRAVVQRLHAAGWTSACAKVSSAGPGMRVTVAYDNPRASSDDDEPEER